MRAPALAVVALLALALPPAGCRRGHPRLERGDAAVVVRKASTAPVAEGMTALPEQEPAEPGTTAMPVALPTGGALAIQGTLTPSGPGDLEDRFALQLGDPSAPAPDGGGGPSHQLAVEVTAAATLVTTVQLRDAQGKLLLTSTAAGGQRHGVPNLATGASGRFEVTVKRAGKTGAKPEDGGYLLVLRSSPLGPGDEREPNEDVASATPIGPAHAEPQVAGYLGTRGDQDVYRVPLGEVSEGSVIHLDLETPPEVVGSLAVLDGQGRRLAAVKGRKGERLGLRDLEPLRLVGSVGAPAAGAFFHALVRAEGPGELGHRYVLGVRAEPAADREREPNDDPARPTPLVGEGTGHIVPGDVDVYRLEARTEPGVLELQPPPRLDLSLEVAAGGGWTRIEHGGRGQAERAPVAAGAALLVRVVGKRPTDGDLDGTYRLSLAPGQGEPTPAGTPPP
jgi:hypothetical protein